MEIQSNQPKQNSMSTSRNPSASSAQFKAMFQKKIETLDKDSVQQAEREEQAFKAHRQIKIKKVQGKQDPKEESIDQTLAKIKDRIKAMMRLQKKQK